ncbi:hypothetical protein [Niastella populi]|uniref:Phosphoribosyltransferase domain-containing protein n=1 Tax=Niastella populi TaxID=550983 RepID=A0A1V9FHK0_9BACT|nr:hypothetical protein [Niastella populi]OQP57843.1 hypothetical protein A4R26_23325 [Niastella populi]
MISLLTEWKYRTLGLHGAWHLCYYVSAERQTNGTLPYYVIQFKDNNQQWVHKWCNWASTVLSGTDINFDCIIRALGSRELRPSGQKALDKLGTVLAKQLNCEYSPTILAKHRETPPMHTIRTRDERRQMMENVYFVANQEKDLNNKNVLILDDVTTSNTTISAILEVLKQQWPHGRYYFFCLGKTEYDGALNESINLSHFN